MTMKVQLVVTTSGPNQGRVIPILGPKFLIGRDSECQLRPASPAISKLHCGLFIRDMKVYLKDLGSTNGTLLNGVAISEEVALESGASIKVGPLEFRIVIEVPQRKSDSTPTPEALQPLSPQVEALRTAAGTAATASASKPAPAAAKPGSGSQAKPTVTTSSKPSGCSQVKPVPAGTSAPAKVPEAPAPAASAPPKPSLPTSPEDPEAAAAAALLFGLEDDSSSGDAASIPEGSTVMELPAIDPQAIKDAEDKKKKKSVSGAEMSATANDILRKYIRRTGN